MRLLSVARNLHSELPILLRCWLRMGESMMSEVSELIRSALRHAEGRDGVLTRFEVQVPSIQDYGPIMNEVLILFGIEDVEVQMREGPGPPSILAIDVSRSIPTEND